jgi:hypothetical protein
MSIIFIDNEPTLTVGESFSTVSLSPRYYVHVHARRRQRKDQSLGSRKVAEP